MTTSKCTLQDCVTETRCTASNLIQECLPACLPREIKEIRLMMLIIIGVVYIIGVAGNIITIVTFLYAKIFRNYIRKRYGQEFKVKDKAVYLIAHLALTDLVYCMLGLPSYWIVYYEGYFPFGAEWCRMIAFLRNWIAYIDFLTVAMISVYLCLSVEQVCSQWSKFIFNEVQRNLTLVVLGMWSYSFGVAAIPLFGLCGEYGYDAQHGKCHIIACDSCFKLRGVDIRPGGLCVGIGVVLPLVAILGSYGCIGYRLYKYTVDNTRVECRQKDDDTPTKTAFDHIFKMLILTICYIIFILPISIIEFVSVKPIVAAGVYCFYWLIYIINFVIYVFTWPTFRKAIKLLFKDLYAGLACNWEAFICDPPGDITSATKRWWDGIQNSAFSATQDGTTNNAILLNATTHNAVIK